MERKIVLTNSTQVELWSELTSIFRKFASHIDLHKSRNRIKNPALEFDTASLKLVIENNTLIFNEHRLDLRRKPTVLRLFAAFINSQTNVLNREQLFAMLFGESQPHLKSARYLEACHHNLVKLISRAREIATSEFSVIAPQYVWFQHDRRTKLWTMVQLKCDIEEDDLKICSDPMRELI